MIPFHLCLILSILTSLVILPILISPVKTHLQIFLLPIIHRTHKMLAFHYIGERTHIPLKIHPIPHMSFLKTNRVNILASNLPVYVIHQIMTALTNIPNFLIMVFVISMILHLIMMLIHSFLIFLNHSFPTIYLLTKWKPCRPSMQSSLS